jgi:hypothetical protein
MERTAGSVLAQAEGSIGTAVKAAVAQYYQGHDLTTAQTIRRATTDSEATKIVTAMRQGRVLEVLIVGGSAALGVVTGALAQKALGNATVKGVPVMSPLGLVPTVAGIALPISLSGRSMLAAGGLSFAAGAALYKMITAPPEGTP